MWITCIYLWWPSKCRDFYKRLDRQTSQISYSRFHNYAESLWNWKCAWSCLAVGPQMTLQFFFFELLQVLLFPLSSCPIKCPNLQLRVVPQALLLKTPRLHLVSKSLLKLHSIAWWRVQARRRAKQSRQQKTSKKYDVEQNIPTNHIYRCSGCRVLDNTWRIVGVFLQIGNTATHHYLPPLSSFLPLSFSHLAFLLFQPPDFLNVPHVLLSMPKC